MYFLNQIRVQFVALVYLSFESSNATERVREDGEKKKPEEISRTPVEKLEAAAQKSKEISRRTESDVKNVDVRKLALEKAEGRIPNNEVIQSSAGNTEVLGDSGNDILAGESGGDIINAGEETPTEVAQIAGVENIDTIFSEISKAQPNLVISDNIQNQVTESLKDNPIENAEEMSEADIQSEIMRRTIALKVEEQNTRLLAPVSEGEVGETEADFIVSLESEFGLDANSLIALRAENHGGIGGNIDETGEITNPEEYKQEMQALAERAQQAQKYAAENENLLAAGNQTILANMAAILDGQDINTLSADQEQAYRSSAIQTQTSGDGFSSLGRLSGAARSGFDSVGSGIGTVNTDPSQLTNLPATSVEKAGDLSELFGSAIDKYDTSGEFAGWNDKPALHQVVMKESGGIVGRLNYTFQAVADQMGTKIDDPQFVTYIHNQLKDGARASDFGIRSTATGVGQFIRANVLAHYPEGFGGIGDADQESIGMLRYIKERYGTPEETVAQYGVHHEGY